MYIHYLSLSLSIRPFFSPAPRRASPRLPLPAFWGSSNSNNSIDSNGNVNSSSTSTSTSTSTSSSKQKIHELEKTHVGVKHKRHCVFTHKNTHVPKASRSTSVARAWCSDSLTLTP